MTFSKSLIGYAVTTITDPTTYTSSLIGYAVTTISDPSLFGPSAIGYAVTFIGHQNPVYVKDATGHLRAVPILTWDGTTLR